MHIFPHRGNHPPGDRRPRGACTPTYKTYYTQSGAPHARFAPRGIEHVPEPSVEVRDRARAQRRHALEEGGDGAAVRGRRRRRAPREPKIHEGDVVGGAAVVDLRGRGYQRVPATRRGTRARENSLLAATGGWEQSTWCADAAGTRGPCAIRVILARSRTSWRTLRVRPF